MFKTEKDKTPYTKESGNEPTVSGSSRQNNYLTIFNGSYEIVSNEPKQEVYRLEPRVTDANNNPVSRRTFNNRG